MEQLESTARQWYEQTYRELRKDGGVADEDRLFTYFDEVQDCALESFDNRKRRLTGWRNSNRYFKFNHLMGVRYPDLGWPF